MSNPYAPKKRVSPTPEPESALPEDVSTIKEILEWVGDDVNKANLVLAEEEASDTPRKTLITKLGEIIDG